MAQGPTHQFCPQCNAMLPPHLVECPRCGQDLLKNTMEVSTRDIFRITGFVLLIALVPLLFVIAVAAICLVAAR